ncbi:MAG: ATP-binding protein [Akkermansiaceae bacterium]
MPLPQLEQRLSSIDSELKQIASYTLRGDTGSLGYRSKTYKQAKVKEWIKVELEKNFFIDQVTLIPTLWRDSNSGVRSEGFPRAFRVYAGTDNESHLVHSFTIEDQLVPRIAPLVITFPSIEASWIKIETSILSPSIGEKIYTLQLSEILVFSGQENVALQKPVIVPNRRTNRATNHEQFLTDGFSPFLMDSAQGLWSKTELIRVLDTTTPPTLSIDLQKQRTINQINLHTAGVALSIPMINFTSWGVPRHIRVTAANKPDFSDEHLLFEDSQESIYDTGPIIMRRFPETRCRYIQITILDHRAVISLNENSARIGFSEIEVLSAGENIAQGATVTASSNLSFLLLTLEKLTDGRNYYGEILTTRDWMNQLHLRHRLEIERPLVIRELGRRYQRQRRNLHILAWFATLLTAGTIITLLSGKVLRQRAIFQTREQIAANLHDELGANLHAIGLFGDLAKQEVSKVKGEDTWKKLTHYIEEVRDLTEHAGNTARYTTNMLEAKELYEDLSQEMKRTAERLLTDLEHDIYFSNEDLLQNLSPHRRLGLFLFYKECLTNIIRHSGATRVTTDMIATPEEICLSVCDNGRGLNETPASLKRRARLLKGKLSAQVIDESDAGQKSKGGTQITIKLKPRRQWRLFRRSNNE